MNQDEQTNQAKPLTDLPLTDEQAEQAKAGSDPMSYNFAGIEGAVSSQRKVGEAGACMQETEPGITGMFA